MNRSVAEHAARLKLRLSSAPSGRAGLAARLAAAWKVNAAILALVHVAATGLFLASWVFIGNGVLQGRLDPGWMSAWALSLLTAVLLWSMSRWLEGVLATGLNASFKQRLIDAAMRQDIDDVRERGAGQVLADSLEMSSVEQTVPAGLTAAMLCLLELPFVMAAFAYGADPVRQCALLLAFLGLIAVAVAVNLRRMTPGAWLRVQITASMTEKMAAHRTRLAQQQPACWHVEEDRALSTYHAQSRNADRTLAPMEYALPRLYLVVALAGMVSAFIGSSADTVKIAVALGTILFAAATLARLTAGLSLVIPAWIVAKRIRSVSPQASASPRGVPDAAMPTGTKSVMRVNGLGYTASGRRSPVLTGVSLDIRSGARLLLQGKPGSGKSTFGALLAGLRQPAAGYILAGGALDRQTAGAAAWRRWVAYAPQDHENHLFSGSLALNLLLGRPYPFSKEDVQDAADLCRQLGLGPLLEKMPAGLDQMVGESGWRLSDGERTRVFLARALLQRSALVVLDESLATLDPMTLRRCVDCLLQRAPALLVIAHP